MIMKFCKYCQKDVDVLDKSHWYKRPGRSNCYDCLIKKKHNSKKWWSDPSKKDFRKKYDEKQKENGNLRKRAKKYRERHRDRLLKNRREKYKYHYDNKTDYYIGSILRNRLNDAIKNSYKNGSATRDLGCTIPELKQYLESNFQTGMTWDNHSPKGWHIDHILPLSSFDLTDRDQLKKACHYTNLQPLWAKDNLSKGNKLGDS